MQDSYQSLRDSRPAPPEPDTPPTPTPAPERRVKHFYIAGSWKSIDFIRWIWARLEPHTYHDWSAYGFLWKEIPETGPAFLKNQRVVDTFHADVRGIRECDVFALVAPGGNSSHIETGMAHAFGKRMILIGEPSKDCFYNVFDEIYDGGEAFLRGEVQGAE